MSKINLEEDQALLKSVELLDSSRLKNKSKMSEYENELGSVPPKTKSEPGISQQSKTVVDTRAEVALRQEIDDFDGFNNSSDEEGVESIESDEPRKNYKIEDDDEDIRFKEAY
jgi:hypothetical protein